jgi:hypothetical protein
LRSACLPFRELVLYRSRCSVLHAQWFESLPIVRRLISGRRGATPPLIVPRARVAAGPRKPAATATTTVRDPVGNHSWIDDEGIRATLAGIAAELEESELTDSRRRWRVALGVGSVIAIGLIIVIARYRPRDPAFSPVALTRGTGGEVANRVGIDSRPPAMRPSTIDANRPLSRDTASARYAAHADALGPAVSEMAVSPAAVRVRVSRTAALTATLTDEDGDDIAGRRVSWTSSKPRIATVSPKGVVRGRAPGTATVTASSGGKKASALVIVTRQPPTKAKR